MELNRLALCASGANYEHTAVVRPRCSQAERLQKSERESIISLRRSSSALTYSLCRFMAKNAAGRSLESILQAVKHDYCFEPFTAGDKPQNKNEIKAQLLRFAVKFYHQIHSTQREKRGLIRAESLLTRFFPPSLVQYVQHFCKFQLCFFPLPLFIYSLSRGE